LKQGSTHLKEDVIIDPDSRIAIIASRFNAEICEGLLQGATKALKGVNIQDNQVDIFRVPGAFEIPLVAKRCTQSKKYQGIVCLGAVIKGETPHFDFICQATASGIGQVSLESLIPISFGVLTTNNLKQAQARSGNDDSNKGREAVLSLLEMMEVMRKISNPKS